MINISQLVTFWFKDSWLVIKLVFGVYSIYHQYMDSGVCVCVCMRRWIQGCISGTCPSFVINQFNHMTVTLTYGDVAIN